MLYLKRIILLKEYFCQKKYYFDGYSKITSLSLLSFEYSMASFIDVDD